MKLITDAQAEQGDLPDDWLWVQTDRCENGYSEAYRTRDGFYFLRYNARSDELIDHGTATQKKTVTYVPEASQ